MSDGPPAAAAAPSPKLFISYSWTTKDHEAWVIDLATKLRENGVDAILDKWDLKEGHDAVAFMESMVSDASIQKVILICDKAYVQKTDQRRGGVGTEAQIVSAEIYQQQKQDKFVAVVVEADDDGKPCLPVYYKARIFINMLDPAVEVEGFEQLLRWVYDQPLHKKPSLGAKPAFLDAELGKIQMATSSFQRRTLDALRSGKDTAVPLLREYLDRFAAEMENFRLMRGNNDNFDEEIVENITKFLPYRNEVVETFLSFSMYRDTDDTRVAFHRFFENIMPLMERAPESSGQRYPNFENYKFLVHELFLYLLASLIKNERFDSVTHLLSSKYVITNRHGEKVLTGHSEIRHHMRSFEARSKRLHRLSSRADLLKDRADLLGLGFEEIMQADFVVYLRNAIATTNRYGGWWPETLVYADRKSGPFEIFARAHSLAYFNRMKGMLGIDDIGPLREFIAAIRSGTHQLPRWEFDGFNPISLTGLENLVTSP